MSSNLRNKITNFNPLFLKNFTKLHLVKVEVPENISEKNKLDPNIDNSRSETKGVYNRVARQYDRFIDFISVKKSNNDLTGK
jgi:hypothetical protein